MYVKHIWFIRPKSLILFLLSFIYIIIHFVSKLSLLVEVKTL